MAAIGAAGRDAGPLQARRRASAEHAGFVALTRFARLPHPCERANREPDIVAGKTVLSTLRGSGGPRMAAGPGDIRPAGPGRARGCGR